MAGKLNGIKGSLITAGLMAAAFFCWNLIDSAYFKKEQEKTPATINITVNAEKCPKYSASPDLGAIENTIKNSAKSPSAKLLDDKHDGKQEDKPKQTMEDLGYTVFQGSCSKGSYVIYTKYKPQTKMCRLRLESVLAGLAGKGLLAEIDGVLAAVDFNKDMVLDEREVSYLEKKLYN